VNKNLQEDEPTYVAALTAVEEHMSGHHMGGMGGMKAVEFRPATTDQIHNLALAVKRIRLEQGF